MTNTKLKTSVIAVMMIYIIGFVTFYQSQFQSYQQIAQASNLKVFTNKSDSNKVILIIIDALRLDYLKRIPIILGKQKQNPQGSYISKIVVGNPTMTTQRVQSLMTGSEIYSPAAILSNFYSSKVQIDNIISQLNIYNKSSAMLGDNTWSILFNFTTQYPCDTTFDIRDYETCDQLIYDNLRNIIRQNNHSFVVAHFLALDHIGHATSSISDNQMNIKMNLISDELEKVIQEMSEDSVLILTGDHGMRKDGNHGGNSQQQIQTFLFAYSKKPFYKVQNNFRQKRQSDITSTLSILLDIPLTRNSIGIPILQILPFQLNQASILNIYQQIHQQYTSLLSYNHINCPSLQSNLNIIQQVTQSYYCIQGLSNSSPSNQFVLIGFSIMLLSFLIFSYLIKLSLLEYIICICTTLMIPFSWYLIRNTSTYLLVSIVSIVCLQRKIKFGNKLMVIIVISLILCQLQPQKQNEYQNNILFKLEFAEILKSKWLNILFGTFFYIFVVKKQYSKKQYLSILLITINLLDYLTIILFTDPNYILRFVHAINLVIYLSTLRSKTIDTKKQIVQISILSLMCLFLGWEGPILILLFKIVMQNIKNAQLQMSIIFLYSQYVWWILGNRYEYSSIDIKKSYIYSSNYNSILNPICLFMYLICPYVICISHLLLNSQKPNFIPLTEDQFQGKQDQKNYFFCISIFPKKDQNMMQRFVCLMMISLISCSINLFFNNGKILFTVVYVPLVILTSLKTITLLSLNIISKTIEIYRHL